MCDGGFWAIVVFLACFISGMLLCWIIMNRVLGWAKRKQYLGTSKFQFLIKAKLLLSTAQLLSQTLDVAMPVPEQFKQLFQYLKLLNFDLNILPTNPLSCMFRGYGPEMVMVTVFPLILVLLVTLAACFKVIRKPKALAFVLHLMFFVYPGISSKVNLQSMCCGGRIYV